MIAVSGVLVLAGYQLVAYGWSQLQHQNAGFFDILWPGRYKGNTPDGGTSSSSPVAPSGTRKFPGGLTVSPLPHLPIKGL